jgi:hypothetical protein
MNLTEEDAYALWRAVSMMEIPNGLKVSPLIQSLLATLDWKNNPTHWSLLQQIVTHNPAVATHVLRIDPTQSLNSKEEAQEETFVPSLPKSAQLSDKLLSATDEVGQFHRDCMVWLSKRSPMTPRIFLESGPLWNVGPQEVYGGIYRNDEGDVRCALSAGTRAARGW